MKITNLYPFDRYIIIAPFLFKNLAMRNNSPDIKTPGDYVVSGEGVLVGINEEYCLTCIEQAVTNNVLLASSDVRKYEVDGQIICPCCGQ